MLVLLFLVGFTFGAAEGQRKKPRKVDCFVQIDPLVNIITFQPAVEITERQQRSLQKDLKDAGRLGFGRNDKESWITIAHLGGPTMKIEDVLTIVIKDIGLQLTLPVRPAAKDTKQTARGSPPRALIFA